MTRQPKQPKKPEAKAELVLLTPQLASEWLTKNDPENRNINQDRVNALAHDIKEGNWKTNGDTIMFGKGGVLMNGQHRCSAVVAANKAVWVWAIYDKAVTIHDPIDQGLGRTVAFVAGLSVREASTYAWLYRLENATLQVRQRVTSADTLATKAHYSAMYQKLREHEGMNLTRLPATLVATAIWTLSIDEKRTIDFLIKVQDGEMIRRGDPAFSFRKWHKEGRLTGGEVILGSLNALRHHLQDRPLKSIYTGEMGYRAACAKRRALKVARTPGTELVVGVSWPVSDRPEREVAAE